jgi:hypothetical protein
MLFSRIFQRLYISKTQDDVIRYQEFDTLAEMESTPVFDIENAEEENITVGEFAGTDLLKYYKYERPVAVPETDSNAKEPIDLNKLPEVINIDSNDGIVTCDNGLRMSIESYELMRSMEMAAIRGEQAPQPVVARATNLFVPDKWYRDNIHKGEYDAVACDVQFDANVGYESILDIWFGFIRVKEENSGSAFSWKFNSIYMLSTISKTRRIFGRNSFDDSDFERLASYVGFKGCENIMNLADKGDDISIANKLELKPCNHASIFSLCNDARQGVFI